MEDKRASVEFSPELEYKQVKYLKPSQRLVKLQPIVGGVTWTISPNASQVVDFQITAGTPFCLAKSVLSFSASFLAGGGGNYTWLEASTLPYIQTIQLQTSKAVPLVEINNAPFFMKLMNKLGTPFSEYMHNDLDERLTRSNAPFGQYPGIRYDGSVNGLAYTEPRYFTRSGVNSVYTDDVKIEMREWRDTLLACQRELLFEDDLILRITFAGGANVAWTGTSANDPSAGAAVLATNYTISSLAFYLMIDQDPNVLATLRSEIHSQSGLKLLTPWCETQRLLQAQSATMSTTIRVPANRGKSLLKIVFAAFANGTAHQYLDHTNNGGVKIQNFYPTLQSRRLIDFNADCTALFEDWMLMRNIINDTCLQSIDVYQTNWSYVSDFSGLDPADKNKDNKITGIPLNEDLLWVMNVTTPNNAAQQHFTIVVLQRELVIKPGIVQLI